MSANINNIEGGYKATLSNPKSSEEARQHAMDMLNKMSKGEDVERANPPRNGDLSEEDKHRHHIEGGYKATLSNPKSSEEAKKHAQEMLDKISRGEEVEAANPSRNDNLSEDEKHRHHIIGGYKATLNNESSSEEAKKHAQEMLDRLERGEELSESERNFYRTSDLSEDEKHRHHVIGGYKATLNNDSASEEAKKHAQEMLDKLEKGEELPESEKRGLKRSSDDVKSSDKESSSGSGKQGFASMPKEKVQEIASKGGRTKNAGEEPSSKKSKTEETKDDTKDLTEDDKHNHHVIGGYKATLSNPKSSEEAKKHAQEMLDKLEKGEEVDSESKSESKSSKKSDSKSETDKSGKGKQGFASMPKEKVQEIASKGGRTKNAGEEPTAVKNN